MKIHRFIGGFNLSTKETEIKDEEIVNQIKNVLKLKVGEKIELCDGKHIFAIADICNIGQKSVSVKIFKKNTIQTTNTQISLFCAVLKKENFELVVQKTTECGIFKIVPIITSRTIKTGLNLERLKKIAREASEQSGRTTVPEIIEPIKFSEAIKNIGGKSVLFDVSGSLFTKDCKLITNNNLFIGPEGGWTIEEIEKAKELNFQIASLGPLTLRGETAAIIATYLISNLK